VPEGDAVLRTALRLDAALGGEVLTAADLRWPTVATVDLVGRTVLGTGTYGKHLLTRFDDGRTLHTHLRMEGSWRVVPGVARGRDPDVRVLLATTAVTALGLRLGMVDVVPTAREHELVGHLGPDLLAPGFPTDGLREALRRLDRHAEEPVGQVLLDQTVVAGLGTLWTAEVLWARRTWPWAPVGTVGDPASLLMAARTLMQRATTPDGRADPARARGSVHGRAGLPCPRCGAPIGEGRVGVPPRDRPMFWCPACQPGLSRRA